MDPVTLIGAGSLLLIIGLIATFVPAHTGAQTEPALVLRCDA